MKHFCNKCGNQEVVNVEIQKFHNYTRAKKCLKCGTECLTYETSCKECNDGLVPVRLRSSSGYQTGHCNTHEESNYYKDINFHAFNLIKIL